MPAWFLYAALAICFWGAWGVVSKLAADRVPPLLNQILSTIGLLPPALVALWQAGQIQERKGLSWGFLAGLAGALGNLAFLVALTRGGQASVVVPLAAIYPLITVVLATIFLRERLSGRQLIAIGLALAAIVFLNVEGSARGLRLSSSWFLFAIAAMTFYGLSALLQKMATLRVSAETSFLAFTAGFIPLAVFIVATDSLRLFAAEPIQWNVGSQGWLWGVLGGALNGLGVLASLSAYRHGGKASVVTPLAALYPVLTVLMAVLLLGERVDTPRIIGIALALAAAVGLSYEPEAEDR